ncbi:MAG: methyltransferase domain-containing protein [Acidobacteria bacterium]|nr:methyltransferase domain-containing protein [Acidobacteriota bacterium]MCI0723635.1 methyltransferase domain-containing protein [Acidobacteriota bacterium]
MSQEIRQQYEEVVRNYRHTFENPAGEHYAGRKMSMFREALPAPSPSMRLLEVGTADGIFTKRFVALGYRVVGLDFASAQLQWAAAENPHQQFVQADGQSLPFDEGAFDGIVSMCTLRYFKTPDRALAEFMRCLKPGGVLIVDVPNLFCPFYWGVDTILDHIFGVPHPAYTRTFTREGIEGAFASAGFTAVRAKHLLLTYRYFPNWLFQITKAAEGIIEPLPVLRRLGALIICSGRKPRN